MKNPIHSLLLFFKICTILGVLFSLSLITAYYLLASPPVSFGKPIEINVEKGQSLMSVAKELEADGIVRSAKIAVNLLVYANAEKKIKAGTYIFKEPESVFTIVKRFLDGDYGYVPVRVLVPEGTNYKQLAQIINNKFPNFSTSTLETDLQPLEGYLFPDTYFFAPSASEGDVIDKMKETFNKKIAPYKNEINNSGRSLSDIIILASILEEEVNSTEDRKMVADLLLRRIEMKMPLQVDATLKYETGKGSAQLSVKDLRTDSLYNTYTRRGLPPTPISNPGLDTILASLRPTPNDYLFYLSDKDGITHFAKTHDEHVRNKAKYLK